MSVVKVGAEPGSVAVAARLGAAHLADHPLAVAALTPLVKEGTQLGEAVCVCVCVCGGGGAMWGAYTAMWGAATGVRGCRGQAKGWH